MALFTRGEGGNMGNTIGPTYPIRGKLIIIIIIRKKHMAVKGQPAKNLPEYKVCMVRIR